MALVSIAVVVTGTDACQDSYQMGAQVKVTRTPGAGTPSTGDDTATPTATPTDTPTASPTVTPRTQSIDGIVPNESSPSSEFLQELSALSTKDDDTAAEPAAKVAAGVSEKGGNWLGGAFAKGAGSDSWRDADGDGFSDSKEEGANSDLNDASSVPQTESSNQLDSRVREVDPDMDGLSNDQEAQKGTNPQVSDSDGDGKSDGGEVLSGGDPLKSTISYADADGDSLSDPYEQGRGLDPKNLDSDSDGLRDDLELVVGSNPLKVDSDGDGISDGREFDLGSDPILGEPDRIQQ
jgi:hypothetical protein